MSCIYGEIVTTTNGIYEMPSVTVVNQAMTVKFSKPLGTLGSVALWLFIYFYNKALANLHNCLFWLNLCCSYSQFSVLL